MPIGVSKIRTGVIGFGDVSKKRFFPQLIGHDGFELASVADILPEYDAFSGVTKPSGVEYHKLDINDNYQIPEDFFGSVDVVYIASPNGYHVSQIVKALLSHGKFVVTEKPVARTREELDILKSATGINDYSSRLFCQDHYIFKPISRFASGVASELIDKDGPIEDIKVTFFESGGTLSGPRGRWLISPLAGGGVYIDIGPHMSGILYKVFNTEFVDCKEPELYDMCSNHNFQCETGIYDEISIRGEHVREGTTAKIKIAKGVDTVKTKSGHEMPDLRAKIIEVNLENADLLVNFEDLHDCSEYVGNRIKKERHSGLEYSDKTKIRNGMELRSGFYLIENGACKNLMDAGVKKKFSANEYRALLDAVERWIRDGSSPDLDIRYAEQSHKAVFKAYDSAGGVHDMKGKLKGSFGDIMGFLGA